MAFNQEEMSPIAISYKSSGLKISKQFNAQTRMTRLPIYAKKYKVTVVEMKDGTNQWYDKKLIPVGFVDAETYKSMEENFEALKAMNIKIDTTGEDGHGDTSFEGTEL
jgi:hypothetical protein